MNSIDPFDVKILTESELGISPFIEEQLAIESSNALRAAEIGLRGMRSRPLLHRLWESVTGEDQERSVAIMQDLITVQHATVSVVKTVMDEIGRTKASTIRILHNLHQVNEDVDELQELVSHVTKDVQSLRQELRSEVKQLAAGIEEARQLAIDLSHREAIVRRQNEYYVSNALHPGTGDLLGAALFLAQRDRYFILESASFAKDEHRAALSTIGLSLARLSRRPVGVTELFSHLVDSIPNDKYEQAAFVACAGQGPATMVLKAMFDRKRAGLGVSESEIKETLKIVMQLYYPNDREKLRSVILFPKEFSEIIAGELNVSLKGA
jgi:hypothetical protein